MERHADPIDAAVAPPIRRARPEDALALAALCGQLGYPTAVEAVRERLPLLLDQPDQRLWVALGAGERVVGFLHAALRRQLETAAFVHVAALVVAEDQRSRGIGRRLLDEAEGWALASGVHCVRVRSNVVRERAHGFYARAGYARVKTSHLFAKQLA